MRGSRGQTTAEYMGTLLIVAAVLLAVSVTPVGDEIRKRAQELVCQIAGVSCPQDPPPSACVVSEQSASVSVNGNIDVRLVNIKLEGGVEYVRQLRANGEVAITVKLPTSGAVGPALEEGARARRGAGRQRRQRGHARGDLRPGAGRRGRQV